MGGGILISDSAAMQKAVLDSALEGFKPRYGDAVRWQLSPSELEAVSMMNA